MKRKSLLVLVLTAILPGAGTPLFAGITVDVGVSGMATAVVPVSRPLGGTVNIGVTLFDYKAIVRASGGVLSPPLSPDYNDAAGVVGLGLLFSPIRLLYIGVEAGLISPIENSEDWYSYAAALLRVQSPGKGFHFFAEGEMSMTGMLNRITLGLNLTL